eukprot:62319-Chlamydomonas_euryale.AAC.9
MNRRNPPLPHTILPTLTHVHASCVGPSRCTAPHIPPHLVRRAIDEPRLLLVVALATVCAGTAAADAAVRANVSGPVVAAAAAAAVQQRPHVLRRLLCRQPRGRCRRSIKHAAHATRDACHNRSADGRAVRFQRRLQLRLERRPQHARTQRPRCRERRRAACAAVAAVVAVALCQQVRGRVKRRRQALLKVHRVTAHRTQHVEQRLARGPRIAAAAVAAAQAARPIARVGPALDRHALQDAPAPVRPFSSLCGKRRRVKAIRRVAHSGQRRAERRRKGRHVQRTRHAAVHVAWEARQDRQLHGRVEKQALADQLQVRHGCDRRQVAPQLVLQFACVGGRRGAGSSERFFKQLLVRLLQVNARLLKRVRRQRALAAAAAVTRIAAAPAPDAMPERLLQH